MNRNERRLLIFTILFLVIVAVMVIVLVSHNQPATVCAGSQKE